MLPLGAPAPTEDWLLAMPLAAPLDAMLPKRLLPDPELGEEVRGSPRRPAAAGIEAQLWRARRRWLAGGGAGRVAGVRRVRVCHSSSECFSPAG